MPLDIIDRHASLHWTKMSTRWLTIDVAQQQLNDTSMIFTTSIYLPSVISQYSINPNIPIFPS